MLVTGSADASVRVWDVGEELFPHADRWASLKTRCILRLENGGLDGCCDVPEALATADDIATLEATMVGVRSDDCRDRDTIPLASVGARATSGNSARISSGLPSKSAPTKQADEGGRETWKRAQSALAVIRAEVFRQAGALPGWRLGRVTAVVDLSRETTATLKSTTNDQRPLIEVRGWPLNGEPKFPLGDSTVPLTRPRARVPHTLPTGVHTSSRLS